MVSAAMGAGASGYVGKLLPRAKMVEAFSRIWAGETVLPEGCERPSPEAGEAAALARGFASLTPQQMNILRLICEGRPNKIISYELSIAEATVKTHIAAIMTQDQRAQPDPGGAPRQQGPRLQALRGRRWRRGARGRDPGCGRGWSRSAQATPMRRPARSSRSWAAMAPALVLVFAAEGVLLAPLTGRLSEAFGPGCHASAARRPAASPSAATATTGWWRSPSRRRPSAPRRSGCATCASTWRSTGSGRSGGWQRGSAATPGWARFGLLMIDGLCRREEVVDRHGRRRPRRPAGRRRLGRRRAALPAHAPGARRREPSRERDLLPRRQRLSGRGGDLRPLHPGERPDGGDRGAAGGAGDPLDQRRAGGGGVCPADRRARGGARAARLRRASAADAAERAARGAGDPGGDAGRRPEPHVLGGDGHDDDARAGGEPDRGAGGADERAWGRRR